MVNFKLVFLLLMSLVPSLGYLLVYLDTLLNRIAGDSRLNDKTYSDSFSAAKIEVSSPHALNPTCPAVFNPIESMFRGAFSSLSKIQPHLHLWVLVLRVLVTFVRHSEQLTEVYCGGPAIVILPNLYPKYSSHTLN